MSIKITVDTRLHSAYITLSDSEIVRTVEFNDDINVDVDAYGVAVGIELLDEGTALPFTQLVDQFHVHSEVIALLRLIRPDVASWLAFNSATDGKTSAQTASPLVTS